MTTPSKSPAALGLAQPAEWTRHDACWLAWPWDRSMWRDLDAVQESFLGLARAIAHLDAQGNSRGERLEVLVPDADRQREAAQRLAGLPVGFHTVRYGDIWLRDTAPIFVAARGRLAAACFRFNGWGGKYQLPGDDEVALNIARLGGFEHFELSWVLEGGSVDVDGEGTVLTTRQCLRNPNRNPGKTEKELEGLLREGLGVRQVVWIDEGLINDHTDGHVDTIARFVRPGAVVCMEATERDDPNRAVMTAIAKQLEGQKDAKGRRLEVLRIPSPGRVENHEGKLLPASYANFYIGNSTVVVPTYESRHDEAAVSAIASLFPGRQTMGVPAKAILSEGGAFHCITQQQPAVVKE